MPAWRKEWISGKCAVAKALTGGAGGAGYAEATLILCAVLSALSAEAWPGRKIDRVRFVEMLVMFGATSDPSPAMISIPALLQDPAIVGTPAGRVLVRNFAAEPTARVVHGMEVDAAEQAVLSVCPSLEMKVLRACSYAALLYEDVRSGYVHQYGLGARAGEWKQTSTENANVSYINRLTTTGGIRRLIHFDVEWIARLAICVGRMLDAVSPPLKEPSSWWLNGASSKTSGVSHILGA